MGRRKKKNSTICHYESARLIRHKQLFLGAKKLSLINSASLFFFCFFAWLFARLIGAQCLAIPRGPVCSYDVQGQAGASLTLSLVPRHTMEFMLFNTLMQLIRAVQGTAKANGAMLLRKIIYQIKKKSVDGERREKKNRSLALQRVMR